jgi:hypothetical protein
MRRLTILIILWAVFSVIGGCSAPDQYTWIPWYAFRGHCYLKMNITVSSLPGEAKVFINGAYQGTTPHTFVHEAASYIAGEKRKLPAVQDGSVRFETRDTEFLGETQIEIMVVMQGYKPMRKTIIMEDNFPSEALDHERRYEKSIRLTYYLREEGWFNTGKGKVEFEIEQPETSP